MPAAGCLLVAVALAGAADRAMAVTAAVLALLAVSRLPYPTPRAIWDRGHAVAAGVLVAAALLGLVASSGAGLLVAAGGYALAPLAALRPGQASGARRVAAEARPEAGAARR
jgi:hypothetical protein